MPRWYVSVYTAIMQAGFGKVQVLAALPECIFMFLSPSLKYQISTSTEQQCCLSKRSYSIAKKSLHVIKICLNTYIHFFTLEEILQKCFVLYRICISLF
jgi:hypothetical protein